jgi:hypothetical protein
MAQRAGQRAFMRHCFRRWLAFAPALARRAAERQLRQKATDASRRSADLERLTALRVRFLVFVSFSVKFCLARMASCADSAAGRDQVAPPRTGTASFMHALAAEDRQRWAALADPRPPAVLGRSFLAASQAAAAAAPPRQIPVSAAAPTPAALGTVAGARAAEQMGGVTAASVFLEAARPAQTGLPRAASVATSLQALRELRSLCI